MRDRRNRTVLIVDGSSTMAYYHGVLLKRLEYEVMTASSAEDALAVMERSLPELALTEISLPRMSGLDLIKAMKASERMKSVHIVALSGESDTGIKAACMGLGCAAYLTKPVVPDLLYRTLQAAAEETPRAHIRLASRLKVIVGDGSLLGGAERTEYATAISEGGLYVRTLYPQPKNTLTPIRLFINDRMITARTEVLYTYLLEGGPFKEPGMGMKFLDLSAEDRVFVREFIRQQLITDIGTDVLSGNGQEQGR